MMVSGWAFNAHNDDGNGHRGLGNGHGKGYGLGHGHRGHRTRHNGD